MFDGRICPEQRGVPMTNEREMKYFCAGLGLGVAAAFLCAPTSGVDLRRQLQSKVQAGAGFVKGQINDAVERGANTVRQQTDKIKTAVEAGTQAYRQATQDTGAANNHES
jgi:gas vesicle protein